MTTTVFDVVQFLESYANPVSAESWDNVGLLLGEQSNPIQSVMTCLTLTPDVAAEAIGRSAGLIVTHHPILFRAVQRVTSDTPEGQMLLDLIRAGVAVYSPHTAFDNAMQGINQTLAEQLKLENIAPLRSFDESVREKLSEAAPTGSGRFGDLSDPMAWTDFKQHLQTELALEGYHCVEGGKPVVGRVGLACGAAGEYLRDAQRVGCDVFITGETRFHTGLEARALGIHLVLLGHYASERPALERLAHQLAGEFSELICWPSETESDPFTWVGKGERGAKAP